MVEVARHQIGAAHEVETPPVRLEDEEPAVLEVAAEDAADADVRAQLRNPGPQRADAAHEEIDLRAGLGGGVELVDDLRMGETVDLDPDVRLLPVAGRVGDAADLLDEALAQGERRDEQLAEVRGPPEAGEVVEEIGDVVRDRLVGGEQPEVLVDARRQRVVVAGADMDVAAQAARLAADDERRLRVDLQAGDAVDDVDSRLLERA